MISSLVDGQSQQGKNAIARTPRRLQPNLLDRWNSPSPSSAGSNGPNKVKRKVSPFWNCTHTKDGSSSFAKNDPSERLVNTTPIKKQNEKSIRNYKEKNLKENKLAKRVPSRGMSLLTKPPTLQDIIAVDSKEQENSELARSHHNSSVQDTTFVETNASDKRMIRQSVKKNLFFDRMDSDELLGQFIDSFEHIEVAKGAKIVTQGDAGDFFYIVGQDSIVAFESDGVKIGEVEDGGSFGELNLGLLVPTRSHSRCDVISHRSFPFRPKHVHIATSTTNQIEKGTKNSAFGGARLFERNE